MNLTLRSGTKPLSAALARHVESSLGLALGRFGERVSEVDVLLQDDPGDGTPGEVRCLVAVDLHPRGRLSFRSTNVDASLAVTHAARRASAGIARHFAQSGPRRTGSGS